MSTDTHGHNAGETPHHKDVTFEDSDIETKVIYRYLMALGFAVIATFIVCIFIERATVNFSRDSETPMVPSREAMGSSYSAMPPEPRLQGVPGHNSDPQQDLRVKKEADNKANDSVQWVDKNAGIAQIPVNEAMKIIAEKGASGAAVPEQKKVEPKK